MNDSKQITWLDEVGDFAGDFGASLAVSGDRWRELNAGFETIDDANGGDPGLAVGRIDTDMGELEFGVLDYGAEITYLLVPSVEQREEMAAAVLTSLDQLGVISIADDVVDASSGPDTEPDLTERVKSIEGMVVQALSAAARQQPLEVPEATVRVISVQPHHGSRVGLPGVPSDTTPLTPDGVVVTGVLRGYEKGGYGLISPDDGSEDLFVHFSSGMGAALHEFDLDTDVKLGDVSGARVAVEIENPEKQQT